MFMTRCRYYDDNGIPVNGGCALEKQGTCKFIHPTHKRWEEARKPTRMNGSPRGIRGRGRGAGTKGHPLALAGAAPRHSDQHQTPVFEPSTWSSGGAMASGDTAARSSSWGAPSDMNANAKINAPADGGGGWGASSSGDGWGATVPTWGDAGGAPEPSANTSASGGESGGWGGSGWGGVADNGWGVDAVAATSAWGTVDQEPRESPAWGRPSPAVDAHPVAGPSRQREGSGTSGQGSVWGYVDGDSRASPPASDMARMVPSTLSWSSNEMSTLSSPDPGSIQPTDNVKENELKIQTASLEATAGPLSSTPESAHPLRPLSQTEIYSRAIRKYYTAISLKLQLEDAQFLTERWKRTMNSASYAHGTPMQRARLEDERAELAQKVANLTRGLKNATNALVDLPLLSASWNLMPPGIDDQELMNHTTSLRNWISELQNFHMLTLPPPPPPPPPVQITPESEDQQLLSEWDQLVVNVLDLEEYVAQMDEMVGYIYTTKSTNLNDEAITAKIQENHKETSDLEKQTAAEWEEVKKAADEIGDRVGVEAVRLADLLIASHKNEQEIRDLQTEKEELENMYDQIEQYLKQFEQWEQEDLERIQLLTEKVQNLHLHPPPTTPQLVSVGSLLPDIQTLVGKSLRSDVLSVIEHLHGACIQNHDLVLHELSRKLQPIFDVTTEMHKQAQLEVASSKHF